jgi:hypothetical protein
VGMMFGAGVGSQSHYFDHHGDGITNPPAINGNNAVSSYADDEGGYIRLQSGAYFSGGTLPLPGGGGPQPTATATRPATSVPLPPTNTPIATATRVPATATSVPPTAISTSTWVPATSTAVPPTATGAPNTATAIPPTATRVPPSATSTTAPLPPTATIVPAITTLVYGDALGVGWENWSWGSSVSLQDAVYKRTGSYSASVAYTRGWGGLYFGHNGFNTVGFNTLEFYVNGGANSGQMVSINLVDAAGNFLPSVNLNQYVEGGSIAANTWRRVSVPLSALRGTNTTITGVVLMDSSGGVQPSYYLDDMVFAAR